MAQWLRKALLPNATPAAPSLPENADLIAHLPPMPAAEVWTRRKERGLSLSLVLASGGSLAALAYLMVDVSRRLAAVPPAWCGGLLAPVAVGGAAALLCELRLLFGDPGVIRRSVQNCLPLPAEAVAYAEAAQAGVQPRGGKPSIAAANLTASDGRSFCVRCCVWRPAPAKLKAVCPRQLPLAQLCEVDENREAMSHHCSVCAHCVARFDHHCGVLGVCITEANMLPFLGLLVLGVAGVIYTVVVLPIVLPAICLYFAGLQWVALGFLIVDALALGRLFAWVRRPGAIEECISNAFVHLIGVKL
ncbi:hypothetical protein AB1Y20_019690 [Prymnesium parvum]|uniref:Palmitoyltransferase n=1 Tax=Prymnesium parvum TaxID=97485 RepID=A0AB34JT44_PRYPA